VESLCPFGFTLPIVLHDHHGSVDFSHCQVCRCWEMDKLPCTIRQGEMDPEQGGWEWGRDMHTTNADAQTHMHKQRVSNWHTQSQWSFHKQT